MQVRLGTDAILTGRVDAVRRRLAKGEHRLELHGRDRAGVLLDCSAPVLARRELTLAEICATYLRPLGIDRMDVQGGDSRKKVTVEPGMSAWEALERAAELAGLWPWFTPDGVLKVAAPDYGRAVDAELILDTTGTKNNVQDLSLEDNCQRRWSEVTVLGQGTGDEHEGAQPAIKAVARDAEAGFSRPPDPRCRPPGDHGPGAGQGQQTAFRCHLRELAGRGPRAGPSHGQRGRMGAGHAHPPHSPPLGLDVDTMLARRTLSCDRQGRHRLHPLPAALGAVAAGYGSQGQTQTPQKGRRLLHLRPLRRIDHHEHHRDHRKPHSPCPARTALPLPRPPHGPQ